MKMNKILASAALFLALSASADNAGMCADGASVRINDFRDAMRLYDKEMYSRSRMMFDKVESGTSVPDAAGYSLLCDVRDDMPGYVNRIDAFVAAHPYSALIPQIRFHHALNLFDKNDYKGASEIFAGLKEKSLYRSQRDGYVFMKAYCCLENDDLKSARDGFAEVVSRDMSDYTAPSRYALGYIEYQLKNFSKAVEWFELSSQDHRFSEMAGYYILECFFMMKDYDYVVTEGEKMYASVPADRKSHLARIISESYLVLGKVEKARAITTIFTETNAISIFSAIFVVAKK